jgi:hypothetical protein
MSVDNHKRKVVEALSSAFEAEYKAGQRRALPNLLMFCFKLDEPVPQWARRVFLEAEHLKSWDEILGPPPRRHKSGPIDEICRASLEGWKLRREGFKIGDDFFKEMGKRLSLKPGTAKRRYYGFPDSEAFFDRYAALLKNGFPLEELDYLAALELLGIELVSQESAEKCEQKDLPRKCP